MLHAAWTSREGAATAWTVLGGLPLRFLIATLAALLVVREATRAIMLRVIGEVPWRAVHAAPRPPLLLPTGGLLPGKWSREAPVVTRLAA